MLMFHRYRTYFPGKQVNCIGGQPVPTPPSINQFGIGKLYNGEVLISCDNSLVHCVDDSDTKISLTDDSGVLIASKEGRFCTEGTLDTSIMSHSRFSVFLFSVLFQAMPLSCRPKMKERRCGCG
jgi:hypothetical protein